MARLTIRDSVIATIVYADIFDYPLTEEELMRWIPLKTSLKRPRLIVQGEALRTFIRPLTVAGTTYYSLRRGRGLIEARTQRARWSMKKWSRARWAGRLLRMIHTIKLIGVTGGLAMNNAKQEDDIDLFVVVSSSTLWVTRFFATLLIELFGVRRKPADTRFADKICLNMFMSESALVLPRTERDLFAAHEVLQMVPLWERGEAYQKFLRANRWVRDFLPNAWEERYQGVGITYYGKKQKTYTTLIHNTATIILRLFEPIAKYAQLFYMNRRRTNEVVSASVIRFHPHDARVWIKKAMEQRLSKFNIPLDKVFYGS